MRWLLHFRICIIICLAVVLISAAVLFSVVRAVLPHATGYKNEVQLAISKQIGLPVEIESIDAAIHWFSPRLKLIRVTVFDKKNKVPLFDFREAFVELDVVESLLRQEIIVADVGLIGADISIEKFSKKEWSVQGVRFTHGESSELPKEFLYMLENSDYLLHDSNIYYQDHTGDKLNISLLNVNIDVENNFNNHDIRFSMLLPEAFGGQLSMVAALSGKLDALDGDIYIEAEQLKIKQWNKKFKFLKTHQLDAQVDIKVWSTIKNNMLSSLTSSLLSRDVFVKNNRTKKIWKTNYLAGDLRYVKDDEHWNISISDFYFGQESKPVWGQPVTVLASDDAEMIYLSADFLRLSDLQDIAEVVIVEQYREDFNKLKAYRLKADLYNLNLQVPKILLSKDSAETDETGSEEKRPEAAKVAAVDADSKADAPKRTVAKRSRVQHGASRGPATVAPAKAEIEAGSTTINSPGESGQKESGDTAGKATSRFEGLSLQATVSDLSFHDQTSSLTLTGFDVILNLQNSRLSVDFATEDASLQMPKKIRGPIPIDVISGELKLDYDGEKVHLTTDALNIKNKHIDTYTRLDLLASAKDDVFVDLQMDFYDAHIKYVHHYLPATVMRKGLVEWLDMAVNDGYIPNGSVILHGKATDFPFRDRSGIFQAMFSPQNINMTFLETWPPISDTFADIKFENLSLYIRNVRGKTQSVDLFNGYIEIPNLQEALLTIKTDAHSRNEDIEQYVHNSPLDKILGKALNVFAFSGENDLNLTLQMPLKIKHAVPEIEGHLTFIDTTMRYADLGYELSSINGGIDFTRNSISTESVTAEMQGRPVVIKAFTEGDDQERKIFFNIDGDMDADYLLQRYDWIPSHWLSGQSTWSVNVEVPKASKDYLVRVKANSHFEGVDIALSDKVNKAADEKINFSTEIDLLSEHRLYIQAAATDSDNKALVTVHADRGSKRDWSFDIQSHYMTGKGRFNESLSKDTEVYLDMDNIDLHAMFVSSGGKHSKSIQPADIPALNWHADNVLWDDWHFTDVELETSWQTYGMTIDRLHLKGPAMTLDATGSWLSSWNGSQETILNGTIKSSNLGDTLTGLGFERSIDRCEYDAVFTSKWPAEPYALSWANMKGETSFEMNDGEILEVNPGAGGRILGLLNIFKLANRLAFDFDDVTRKGFSFDKIKGDFEFVNGDGSLKNFDVSAASADINMFGSIGLVKRDYGLLMRVKPHTSTLTFAGGVLLGGVAVGAGLAIIQNVFDISLVGHNVYSITGSWDDPKIEKIVETRPDTDEYDF